MEVQEKVVEGPILALFSRRIRNKKKKLREIMDLEQSKDGKIISGSDQNKIDRKGNLIAELNELENMKKQLPKAIQEELVAKIQDGSESSKTSDSSTGSDSSVVANKVQVDCPESSKNGESGSPRMIGSVAQVKVNQDIEKRFYIFLKRYKFDGDEKPFYHGDALALLSRRSFRVQYSDIYAQDKDLAMLICSGYERLKPGITEAVKRFAGEVLKKSIKGLAPRKANAANANVENLNLSIVGKPKSHQMLDAFLQPRSIVMEEEVCHSDQENPMKTPSVIGCALLMGILQDLIARHLQGHSCNGHLGIENVEVYDGDKFVIVAPFVRYPLGSPEWAAACKKDFKSYAVSFAPLFETAGKYPPYMDEFRKSLLTVPLGVLQRREECLAFHEFMLEHMVGKPIPVRAGLVSGIHYCCKAFDPDDPVAPYKKILHELAPMYPQLGYWTNAVDNSGNALMKKLLTSRLRKGEKIDCKYLTDLESMTCYLRVLNAHAIDYTKERKKTNQRRRQNRRKNRNNRQNINQLQHHREDQHIIENTDENMRQNTKQAQNARINRNMRQQTMSHKPTDSMDQIHPNGSSISQQLKESDEPQVQRLKLLNELELVGGRHLAPYILEMIYMLLKKKAMTGMLLPVWKAYKSCKVSAQGQ